VVRSEGSSNTPGFDGVVLDWRGTLVVAPTSPWLVTTALAWCGRDASPPGVETVLAQLRSVGHSPDDLGAIDTDATLHRTALRRLIE
jgi:hypothetical protein